MEDFVETFCLKSTESSQFGFVEPCCVQTIQQFREYASFKNLELVCLRENSVVPDTAQCFKFRPCSAKASIQLRPNTAIVTQETSQIKRRLFRNHIISIVFFLMRASHRTGSTSNLEKKHACSLSFWNVARDLYSDNISQFNVLMFIFSEVRKGS